MIDVPMQHQTGECAHAQHCLIRRALPQARDEPLQEQGRFGMIETSGTNSLMLLIQSGISPSALDPKSRPNHATGSATCLSIKTMHNIDSNRIHCQ